MRNYPETWEEVTLGQFGEIVSGGTPDRNNPAYWNGDILWVTPSEITVNNGKYLYDTRERITKAGLNASSAKLLPEKSLLITSRATLGELAIAAKPISTNQGFKSIIPNEVTDPVFAFYLVKTLKSEMVRLASGTTFLEISKSDFSRITAHRPQLFEQTRIAYVLDTMDKAIAATEAMIAKLKQVRAGMLHDLLSYGLDENGQLRDPIAHPEQFKDSPLGRLPRDWDVGPFSKIAIVNPPTPATGLSPFNTISFIPMQDVDEEGNWVHRQSKKLIDCGGGYTPFIEGDVLFAKITPCMENGKGCHARDLVNGFGLGSTEFHVLRAKTNASARFLFHWSMTKTTRTKALAYMTGSAGQQRVEAGFFNLFVIPIPPFRERELIANVIDDVDKQIETSRNELDKIKALKIGLQDDLLTGRVRVPETIMEGAAVA